MIELAGIIILGILAQWFAWKFKIPAILPLILIGLLVGPIAAEFLSEDGTKWIEPIAILIAGLFVLWFAFAIFGAILKVTQTVT